MHAHPWRSAGSQSCTCLRCANLQLGVVRVQHRAADDMVSNESQVCNHPDLFEGRPIVSAYDMWGLDQQLPSASLRALERGPFQDRRPPDPARLPVAVTAHESMPLWAAADIKVCPAAGFCVDLHDPVTHDSSLCQARPTHYRLQPLTIDARQAHKTPEDVIRAPAVSDGQTSWQQDGLQAFLGAEARQRAGRRVSRSKALLEVLLSPPCGDILHGGTRAMAMRHSISRTRIQQA